MLILVSPKIEKQPEPKTLREILTTDGYVGTVWRRANSTTPDFLIIAGSSSPGASRAIVIRGDNMIVVESGSNEWMNSSQWLRYDGNITVTA